MIANISIQLHSFIDLITNSSSEVFVASTDKTVEAVYAVVQNLLKSMGSPALSQDVVDVRLYTNHEEYINNKWTTSRKYKGDPLFDGNSGDVFIEITSKEGFEDFDELFASIETLLGSVEAVG